MLTFSAILHPLIVNNFLFFTTDSLDCQSPSKRCLCRASAQFYSTRFSSPSVYVTHLVFNFDRGAGGTWLPTARRKLVALPTNLALFALRPPFLSSFSPPHPHNGCPTLQLESNVPYNKLYVALTYAEGFKLGTVKRGVGQIVEHGERCSPYELPHSRNIHYLQVVKDFTEAFWLTPRIHLRESRTTAASSPFHFPHITFPETKRNWHSFEVKTQ